MRIAIVNDLALTRELLRRVVLSVPGYRVAWMAGDGAEAVRRTEEDRPDVILMDLVMPVMNGVEATRLIMSRNPCPILLVTSSLSGNINLVYQAMGHGGLDAVDTPTQGPDGRIEDSEALLARLAKVDQARKLSSADSFHASAPAFSSSHPAPADAGNEGLPLLAIGASTGGPEALAQVLSGLPADFPGGVILVQHIAGDFAPNLARWLQGRSALPIKIAEERAVPERSEVLLAASNDHLVMKSSRRLGYTAEPRGVPYRPSVDVFFESLARTWPTHGVAVILTGMGTDGARGLLELKRAGWFTIAQNEATSVVYGMPKAAVALQAANEVLPLNQIAPAICSRLARQPK